ncbi:MAG: TrkA family potassium uptake protein [Bacteroidales bacterium]|jgi:trk system potassium uptake protein|nr:TrkA family potassium uptake protein [Bacteroidales bacterium]
MKIIVIGLGNYGRCLAEELSALGHEIVGVDNNEHRVNLVKDKLAVSYIINVEEEEALTVLPFSSADMVFVCIGENFGASLRVVSLLKKLNVRHIYARAIDATHKSILEAFDIDKILAPEEEAARNLVHLIDAGYNVEAMKLDTDYYIFRFTIPHSFVNFSVSDLQLSKNFEIRIIAIQHIYTEKNVLGISSKQFKTIPYTPDVMMERLAMDDKLVCIGKYKDFQKMWNSL